MNSCILRKEPLDEFDIAGFSIKTSKINGQDVKDKVKFFEKFKKEKLIYTIPYAENRDILGVCYHHDSNQDNEYSYLLGSKVNMLDKYRFPKDAEILHLPPSHYVVFGVEGEDLESSLIKIWDEIDRSEEIERAFNYDFEVYDANYLEHKTNRISVYVSVKGERLF